MGCLLRCLLGTINNTLEALLIGMLIRYIKQFNTLGGLFIEGAN